MEYVEPQPWLRKPRHHKPRIIVIHATRGATTPDKQYQATVNWMKSPNNANNRMYPTWGSSCDYIVGAKGEVAMVGKPQTTRANWSAGYGESGTWALDEYAIAIETAQSDAKEPFTMEALLALADLSRRLTSNNDIKIRRIFPVLPQWGPVPSGFVGHEDSANGVELGKSDPGKQFPWKAFIFDVKWGKWLPRATRMTLYRYERYLP